ncbi:hypothetical protein HON86_01500 [Candidatus Woesearchaeota archaeon]|nr:hypothetical protein [Candidatus Woesearchaeota archaeon]MBT4835277.1 hypothetical protein [Candidatus Woesearchaeota archaeon]MBT6734754.1 hypothetical protein [Candidatus Woesearchaeota archaeon]MBT7169541.1 hypothetical protein [Candidatus Woesearchaeota archaeon]MBT7474343.1 hypothetical protein [Candidatus Woesearchaeota archaeon]
MNLIMLLIIVGITIFVLEMAKHVVFKSFSKTMIMIIMVLGVFFVIIATLYSQNDIETDNPAIISGAAIINTLNEDGYFENLNEKFEGIKQDLSDSFS